MTPNIFSEIIDKDLCIGCGACAAVQPEAIRMTWSKIGFFVPTLKNEYVGALAPRTLAVCPFNDDNRNEDFIARTHFASPNGIRHDKYIGYHQKCYIGYCNDPELRGGATSGGIIAWLIRFVLSKKMADRVAAVGDSRNRDRLFSFNIYDSVQSLDASMKSRYYPSEFSEVARTIAEKPGTALFVGLPCQIKAVRKLALEVPEIGNKIKYTVSLFCGHLKSRHYTDYLAQHLGVRPASVVSVDYRKKREGASASAYGFEITYREGDELLTANGITKDVFASSWSNNLFMNPACEFCDDVVGETADLSVGDAWLPRYSQDWRGTSILVVRNLELMQVLDLAQVSGELTLEEVGADMVYRSQEAGFRQRRDALRYRLALAEKGGRPVPAKRVTPSVRAIGVLDRTQQRLRMRLRRVSNDVFAVDSSDRSLTAFRLRVGVVHRISEIIVLMRRVQRRFKRTMSRWFFIYGEKHER